MKDSHDKYDDVVHRLDVRFTSKKNLSYKRCSFKMCKQKSDEYCSAYITHPKRMGETCEYKNQNAEAKDQFIMTFKSMKM